MRGPARTLLLLAACSGSPLPAPAPAPAPAPVLSPSSLPAPPDPITTALARISQPALLADVAWLAGPDLRGRGLYSPDARRAADALAARFRALGLEVTLQDIAGAPGQVNVIAVHPGDDDVVIVSAHYDHLGVLDGVVYPGADDNASGVAVLLALARATQGLRGRTIVFLSSGAEEAGLVGASAYAQAPIRPLARTVAVINFDMVGRNFFEWTGGLSHTIGAVGLADPQLGAAARRAAAAEKVTMLGISAEMLALFGFDGRTDDHVFRKAGVPALHLSTGMHPDYHKPTDTVERIVGAQLERVARVSARVLVEVAGLKGTR